MAKKRLEAKVDGIAQKQPQKSVNTTKPKVWVYHDSDHANIRLFDTFEKAKKHAESEWPDGFGDEDDHYEKGWKYARKDRFGLTFYNAGEYVTVFEAEVG